MGSGGASRNVRHLQTGLSVLSLLLSAILQARPKKGLLSVKVLCPAEAPSACRITLKATAPGKSAILARKAGIQISPGQVKKARLRLTRPLSENLDHLQLALETETSAGRMNTATRLKLRSSG